MNLAARLATSASRIPDKPALLCDDVVVTYGELDDRVARAAGTLRGLGLEPATAADPGDRVGVMVGNTPAFVEALFGVLRAGLVAVPVNTGFTRDEVEAILADAGARALVADEACLPAVADLEVAGLEHRLVVGSSPGRGWAAWHALLDGAEPAAVADVDESALALLPYTSSATGEPRGAMLAHGNLLANQHQLEQTRLRVEERDIVLGVLPLFHIYGLNVVLAFALARGATLLLVERFDPQATLEAVARHRVTVLAGAPPMYVAWAERPELDELDLASVRFAVSGAAALAAQTRARLGERLGVPVWEGYGLSETAPVLTTDALGERPKPGSVGRPLPGVELRLVDDDGAPVRRGDPGEVVARGPNVFRGYWRDPAATRAVLDDAGWFRTGDIAYADDDGDLHLVDRKRDLVIVSGFNVYPREVETVLVRHPAVADAAVVGVPHAATGEAVKAVVVLAEGAECTAEELRAFAGRHLARFKVPEVVEFADALPHAPSGKIRRGELRGQDEGTRTAYPPRI